MSNAPNQGITVLPGRWIEPGRAQSFLQAAGQRGDADQSIDDDPEKARRFRDAALPYLDDAYTLARYLLRNATDAEDAVQECYLRAFKHFDSYRGPAMKPWLFAILRNVCRAEYARRATAPTGAIEDVAESAEATPLWHEAQETPEAQIVAPLGFRHHPPADRGAGRTVSRNLRAARNPKPVVPRDRRRRRGACRHRDVAPGARPRHAAIGVARGTGATEMTCDEAEILLHALIDGELDAGHAREVENHIAGCPRCAAVLRDYREMSKAIAEAGARYTAPAGVAPAHRGGAAAAASRAEPARRAARLCDGLRGIGDRRDRSGRDRAAQ